MTVITGLQRVERALGRAWQVLGTAAGFSLLVIMFGVSVDAILRYTANRPVTGTLEGAELLLVFAVFLSLARTQAERGHISVTLLSERLSGKPRAMLDAVVTLLGLTLFAVITWATGTLAVRSWEIGEYSAGLIAFPIYISRFLVTLGCLFLCLQLLLDLIRAIVALCGAAPATDERRGGEHAR